MRVVRGFIVPALATVLVHAGMLIVVMENWQQNSERRLVKPPAVINATIRSIR